MEWASKTWLPLCELTAHTAEGKELMEEVLDAVEKFTLIDKVGGGRNQNT
jgi:hypothetical protein